MVPAAEFPTVAHNPWLVCALLVSLRVTLIGAAWAWILPRLLPDTLSPWRRLHILSATIIAIGVLLNSLMVTELAGLFHAYSERLEWIALAIVLAAGVLLGKQRHPDALREILQRAPITAILVFLISSVVMLLPQRGEWIAGGWDPGIYVGQGVEVSRTGTFVAAPDPLLLDLTHDELALFTRHIHGYTELLPVVPIDPDSRILQPFFFRLTPATIAWLDRCGGLRAATRAGFFLGGLGLLVFMGLTAALGLPRPACGAATVLLATHPIWIFQLHFPTSEPLQWIIVAALGILLTLRRHPATQHVLIPLLLFCAVLNRFSFLPFGALFVALLAWLDWTEQRTDQILSTRSLQALGLVAAAGLDTVWSRVSLVRLDELVPLLVAPSLVLLGASLILSRLPLPRQGPATCLKAARTPLVLASLALAGSLTIDLAAPGLLHLGTAENLGRILPYLGWGLPLAAGAGLILLLVCRDLIDDDPRGTQSWIGLVVGILVITLSISAIAGLVPWALRRHTVYTLPLLALLAGVAMASVWAARIPGARILSILLCVGVVAGQGRLSCEAWRNTDFDGLSAALAAVDQHLGERDIVIADHFRWGTPLRLIGGRTVLNGELFWADDAGDRWEQVQPILARWRDQGHRVLLFTSTDQGLAVFPEPAPAATCLYGPEPLELADLIHGPRLTGFSANRRTKHFALYELTPPP